MENGINGEDGKNGDNKETGKHGEHGKHREDSELGMQKFEEAVKGTEKIEGLFTLYSHKKKDKLYLEINPEQLEQNFLCVVTLSSGIGEGNLLRGMPLQSLLFNFKRVRDNLHFVVRNVHFRTKPDDPLSRSLEESFSDSVLYSMPIKSIHSDRKTLLVDIGEILMSDEDPSGIARSLPGILGSSYFKDPNKSYLGSIKAFPLNLEIESVYGFNANKEGLNSIPSLADSRAFTLRVNYSFLALPENNGYRPRFADQRVGYFLTAYRDFSEIRRDEFARYINRWHLEKANISAPLSPPKEPIVFWIENTVPLEYRQAVREGVLMWNQAFEQAGFINAIEVRQMPDNADWDPSDVRYNTIRWSASFDSWFLGLGPSRVNPLTGQILDADIIIDASIIRTIKGDYRNLVQQHSALTPSYSPSQQMGQGGVAFSYPSSRQGESLSQLAMSGNPICPRGGMEWLLPEERLSSEGQFLSSPLNSQIAQFGLRATEVATRRSPIPNSQFSGLCYALEAREQLAVGSLGAALLQNVLPGSEEMEEFTNQYLRFIIAHEVGHTLGLRHNFHGSTMLTTEELHDRSVTRERSLSASVMDYLPANLAPPGMEQGDYFPVVVGPYDTWAIEYGYKPINAFSSEGELPQLADIARQSGLSELSYAPDEDSLDFLDPGANAFDLSKDTLQYSRWQLENAREMWRRLDTRYPVSGESYAEVRRKFNVVFSYYTRQLGNAMLYVAGQSFNRNHAGDVNGKLPFEVIPVEQQREALTILREYVFDDRAFEFPPQLLNKLAPERWYHWGTYPTVFPLDYPIGDRIFVLQRVVLNSLLSPGRLARLRDLELKANSDNVFTIAELFDALYADIWMEVLAKRDNLESISVIRRSLQRQYLRFFSNMVLRKRPAPEDARTLAWYHLRQLEEAIAKALKKRDRHLDLATKAHLEETRARIIKVLQAPLESY